MTYYVKYERAYVKKSLRGPIAVNKQSATKFSSLNKAELYIINNTTIIGFRVVSD